MRIDVYLVEHGKFQSRARAQAAIKDGKVLIDNKIAKCSDSVGVNSVIEVIEAPDYVSMGMFKLRKALDEFDLSVEGKIAADIGASTGGFTSELLARGAKCVYAVDVGENQLAASLLRDNRVSVMDRTNARNLTASDFPQKIDIITVDVSFISLKLIIPAVRDILPCGGEVVALVKPQFEAGKAHLNKHGIVKDARLHMRIIEDIKAFSFGCGFSFCGLTNAPEREGKNIEYLMYLKRM